MASAFASYRGELDHATLAACERIFRELLAPLRGAYDAELLRFVIAKSLGLSRVRRAAAR